MYGNRSSIATKASEKREAKQRAMIMRQVTLIENLLAMLPPKKATEPVYRLLREVLEQIKAEQRATDPTEAGSK